MTPDSEKFAQLGYPNRVWAISAIHCESGRLAALHDHIGPKICPGDRVVYTGNMIGRGEAMMETIAELLSFRRAIISQRGMFANDFVYLRGAQEEMWQKLLQLQFAPNPAAVLGWMLDQGVAPTLRAYGGSPESGMAAAREGAILLTRWTNELRQAMRQAPGHNTLFSSLKRAAFDAEKACLLVSAGLDTSRPLAAQGDSFWWASRGFSSLEASYDGFARVIRGFDPDNGGLEINDVTASLDGGAGRGGEVVAALVGDGGEIIELMKA